MTTSMRSTCSTCSRGWPTSACSRKPASATACSKRCGITRSTARGPPASWNGCASVISSGSGAARRRGGWTASWRDRPCSTRSPPRRRICSRRSRGRSRPMAVRASTCCIRSPHTGARGTGMRSCARRWGGCSVRSRRGRRHGSRRSHPSPPSCTSPATSAGWRARGTPSMQTARSIRSSAARSSSGCRSGRAPTGPWRRSASQRSGARPATGSSSWYRCWPSRARWPIAARAPGCARSSPVSSAMSRATRGCISSSTTHARSRRPSAASSPRRDDSPSPI